jgi:hypothetical protein
MHQPPAVKPVDTQRSHTAVRPPHPILDIPLDQVLQKPYAMQLQQILQLYTVGNLLGAWRHPECQREIESVFETADQAHHAIATCAAWLGLRTVAAPGPVPAWWAE